MKQDNGYHILTLVIQKHADIPRVRSKVKLLVRTIGGPPEQMTGIAVGASELSRLLLQRYGGGKVRVSVFPVEHEPADGSGLELVFHSNAGCIQGRICILDNEALMNSPPFPGLQRVFAEVRAQGAVRGRSLIAHCRSRDLGVAWDEIYGHLSGIRKELFADTEESYMENLRAKHDEVTRLLKEKTEQNQLLDQSNNELLQLSNDLEELARERTIIEMSLRIADQVRNPATIIGGMARRLLDKAELEQRDAKKVRMIIGEAAKIEKIVGQFNEMAARRRTSFNREDIIALLKDAMQACPTLQRRHIRVQLHGAEMKTEVHANRQLLKIALVHVLRYLAHRSPEPDGLEIFVSSDAGTVVRFVTTVDSSRVSDTQEPGEEQENEQQGGLELVRQILGEHQASLLAGRSRGGEMELTLRFPLVFHQQDMEQNSDDSRE